MNEPPETDDNSYAGLDRRVGAFFLDILLVYGVSAGLQFAISLVSGGFPFNRLGSGLSYQAWFLLTFSLPLWLYFAFLESSHREASLGKRAFKLRVVNLQGDRISFIRALIRTILKLLPWELVFVTLLLPDPLFLDPTVVARPAVFCLYGLLLVYMLAMIASPRKRGIHDLLVGTLVLYDASEAAHSAETELEEN